MDFVTNSIVNDLVNENIIGFDTARAVMGQAPVIESGLLPSDITMQKPLKNDKFQSKDSLSVVQNPIWKKLLFGAITLGGLCYGGYKFKTKLLPLVKKCVNFFKPKPKPTPTP